MKIEIELPDWTDERNIYVFAGIELAAIKTFREDKFRIKDTRCNFCGKCCMGIDPKFHFFPVINGKCVHLINEPGTKDKYRCRFGISRPFVCSFFPEDRIGDLPEFCCITYK